MKKFELYAGSYDTSGRLAFVDLEVLKTPLGLWKLTKMWKNRQFVRLIVFQMRRSQKLKLALAIYGIVLYTSDSGSDLFVGIDLIQRCHDRFAAAVFTAMIMPGVIMSMFSAPNYPFSCKRIFFMAMKHPSQYKVGD